MSKKKKRDHKEQTKKASVFTTTPLLIDAHWDKIVIILLILIPLIYFFPFLNANKMIAGSDYLIGGLPFEKWISEQHEMPLWYPHVFGGIPVLGSPQGGPLAPLAQLKEIIPPQVVLVLTFILVFFLAGLGMYLYLKSLGLSRFSAALGAVMYQFIGNLATTPYAGHAGRAMSIGMFPFMMFFIHQGLKTRKVLYFLLLSIATVFAFYDGHFQITYYGLLFILCYTIYYLVIHRKELVKKDYFKVFGFGLGSIALICLLMAAVWLPVLSGLGTGARGVERGFEYTATWAMPPLEVIDLVIPTYSGILKEYWGFSSFKLHMEYFGVIAVILAIISIIFFLKKRYIKFYLLGALVAFLIAIGKSTFFFRIVYDIVPGFKFMRAPNLIFFLFSFSFISLASIGFNELVTKFQEQKEDKRFKQKVLLVSGILLGILILTGIICAAGKDSIVRAMQSSLRPGMIREWGTQIVNNKMVLLERNFSSFIGGIWRSVVFAFIAVAVVFFALNRRLVAWIASSVLIIAVLFDCVPIMKKFLPETSGPETYYRADDVVNVLKKDDTVYRVFPTPWYQHAQDCFFLYHSIQSVGGYIPNPLRRYQEFIGAGTSVMYRPFHLVPMGGDTIEHVETRYKLIDMLNCRYVIGPSLPQDLTQVAPQYHQMIKDMTEYFSRFTLLYQGAQNCVYINEHALPRAYVVGDYQVKKESEILEYVHSMQFDPTRIVVLENDPQKPHPEASYPLIEAEVLQYTANEVQCEVATPYHGFFVLVDNWHPDWKVFVDGVEKECLQANYIFRGVYIEAGHHEIVFKYISKQFNLGKIITIIALIASLIFLALLVLPHRTSLTKQ